VMYPNRKENKLIQKKLRRFSHSLSGKARVWSFWTLALLLLISSGLTYRVLASKMVNTSISLPVPLSDFPKVIGNWIGTDVPIPTITREYMERNFADDYISRRYDNRETQSWVDLYVVYCSTRPGGMLGHRPTVCYPGSGWKHDGTIKSSFDTSQGRKINCLIHRFHKEKPVYSEVTVLNFYVVNGQLSTDQSGFSGFSGRRFNFFKNPAHYVAQVQISSLTEDSIRTAAGDMTDIILGFLPDENGGVAAFEKYGNY
jgi:EpsI family protein